MLNINQLLFINRNNSLTRVKSAIFTSFRLFHISSILFSPNSNDQDKLYKEIQELELQSEGTDTQIEEVAKKIRQEEEEFETQEGETELSKLLARKEEEKNRFIGDYGVLRNRALFDENNQRKDHSLALDQILTTTRQDIKTLENAAREVNGTNDSYHELTEVIDTLKKQESKTSELINRYHENDLPPISDNGSNVTAPSENSTNYFPQDSSDVYPTDYNTYDP